MAQFMARFGIIVILVAVAVLVIRGEFFSTSPLVIAAQVVAVALSVSARISFAKGSFAVSAEPKGEGIITRGPYRFIRHPMYAAALILIWAAIAGHPSMVSGAIGLAVTALLAVRVVEEEKLLRVRFPDYADYARRTKAIVPFVV